MAQPFLLVKVTRREPEVIKPARLTPYEFKHLSDIDDQGDLRCYAVDFHAFRNNDSKKGKDPVTVIREALAKTLVFYYPVAGRLKEGHNRKLIVECNGEGVLFLEADADVTLDQLSDLLEPPNFPCLKEFRFDVPESSGVLNCPLLLIQVTRLSCGGFVLAICFNHTIMDGTGFVQFMKAVGEIASGAQTPSITPVWERHILNASDPPRVTFKHREYDHMVEDPKATIIPLDNMLHRSFSFGPKEIYSLRRLIPQHLRNCSSFELLTASLWRCRTIALQSDPVEETRVILFVDARHKFNPPLPKGYYGNVIASPVAMTTVGELSRNSIGYAVELVQKAKSEVSEEYMRSVASLMAMKGRPRTTTMVRTYVVTDPRRLEIYEADYGWGKAVHRGIGTTSPVLSRYTPFTNKKGEEVTLVPLSLPSLAMKRFVKEMDKMLTGQSITSDIKSAL